MYILWDIWWWEYMRCWLWLATVLQSQQEKVTSSSSQTRRPPQGSPPATTTHRQNFLRLCSCGRNIFQGRRWIHISFLLLQLGKCSNNKEEWAVIHWPACQYKLFLFDNHFKIGQPTLHNSLVQRLQIKSSQHSLYPSFQFGWIKYLPESHALCRCRILRANLAQTIRVKREREGWTEKFWAAFTKMGKSTFR